MSPSELSEHISLLSQTPARIETLLGTLSDKDVRLRIPDESFSVVETICHLRDIESEGYEVRINRILAEEVPQLADIDGGRLAIDREYNHQHALTALRAFSDARRRNLETLSTLTPDQLSRTGRLENTGKVSLRQLIVMLQEHDQSHLQELETLCRRLPGVIEE